MSGYTQNVERPLLDYALKKCTSHRTVIRSCGIAIRRISEIFENQSRKKSSDAENSVILEHPNDMTNFSSVQKCINLIRVSLIEVRTLQTRLSQFSDHFDYLGVHSTVRCSYVRTYVHRAGSHGINLVCKIENASAQPKMIKKNLVHDDGPSSYYLSLLRSKKMYCELCCDPHLLLSV